MTKKRRMFQNQKVSPHPRGIPPSQNGKGGSYSKNYLMGWSHLSFIGSKLYKELYIVLICLYHHP